MYLPLGGKFTGSPKYEWKFPSGAKIELGHLPHTFSAEQLYQGAAYHRLAFDELTLFTEEQYMYFFSRKRKLKSFPIRLGFRASANPGGPGHSWVKKRFISADALAAIRKLNARMPSPVGMVFEADKGRKFVPARVADNPHLDLDDYLESLGEMPEVLRERQMNGDWGIAEGIVFPQEWMRYYTMRGDILVPMIDGFPDREVIDCRQCRRFVTIDTAGTGKQDAEKDRGKAPAYSVVAVWDHWRAADKLFLRHIWRKMAAWHELKAMAIQTIREWHSKENFVEDKHVGPQLRDEIRRAGLHCDQVPANMPNMVHTDEGAKKDRAIASGIVSRAEGGRLLIPHVDMELPWVDAYEAELTNWTGRPDTTCDQIDVSSYAAFKCKQSASSWGGPIKTLGMARR